MLPMVLQRCPPLLTACLLATIAPSQLDRAFLDRGLSRVAIQGKNNRITLEVAVEGKGPFRFELDPADSADGTIDRSLARRLGLLRGRTDAQYAAAVEIRLGTARLAGLDLRLVKHRAPLRGRLGLRTFRDVLLRIDVRRGCAELYRGQLSAVESTELDGTRAASLAAQHALTIDVKNARMHAATLDDQPRPSPARFAPGTDIGLRLRRARSGHLLVRPLFDGREIGWFVFDTGASQTTINNRRAREVELVRLGNGRTVTPTRTHITTLWQAGSVRVGPMTVPKLRIAGLDIDRMARSIGGAAGVLGNDVLRHAVVELDVASESIALHDPRSFELPGVAWHELRLWNGLPVVAATFDGHDGSFLIDTGDPGTVTMFAPAVRRHRLLEGQELETESFAEVGGSFELQNGQLESIGIAGHLLESPKVSFATTSSGMLGSTSASGSFGAGLLRPFTVILDYSRLRIAVLRRDED